MEAGLSEMIPLASRRGGGTTWEYYFTFDGGKPPWTSAMSQATGLEALSRAYLATKNPYYLQVAAEAMAVLPSFNAGAWSLYSPGLEDDLSYHELVTGFLQQLCTLTKAPVYC